jgi:hypothetical protein
MDLFGRKQRQQDRIYMENVVTALIARLCSLEAVAFSLVAELSHADRESIFSSIGSLIVQLGNVKPPNYVPERNEQPFRDELSRTAQLFIEVAKNLPSKQ